MHNIKNSLFPLQKRKPPNVKSTTIIL